MIVVKSGSMKVVFLGFSLMAVYLVSLRSRTTSTFGGELNSIWDKSEFLWLCFFILFLLESDGILGHVTYQPNIAVHLSEKWLPICLYH